MGQIIDLTAARRARLGTTFAFDLASPWTYLAADAVTEDFPGARWVPALGAPAGDEDRDAAECAAYELGLRFAWPATGIPDGVAAARAAHYAAQEGKAVPFARAAARLTWGHGCDLDDHAVLATAAGAAELKLDAVLEASFDPRRDVDLHAEQAPVLTIGGLVLDGRAIVAGGRAEPAVRRAR